MRRLLRRGRGNRTSETNIDNEEPRIVPIVPTPSAPSAPSVYDRKNIVKSSNITTHDLDQEILLLTAKRDKLKDDISLAFRWKKNRKDLLDKLSDKEKQLNKLIKDINDNRKIYDDIKQKIISKTKMANSLDCQVIENKNQVSILQNAIQELNNALEMKKQAHETISEKAAKCKFIYEKNKDVELQLKTNMTKLDMLKKELVDFEEKNKEQNLLCSNILKLKAEKSLLEPKVNTLKEYVDEWTNKTNQLENINENINENKKLLQELENKTKNIKEIRSENNILIAENEQLNNKIKLCQIEYNQIADKYKEAFQIVQDRKTVEKELSVLSENKSSLLKLIDELEEKSRKYDHILVKLPEYQIAEKQYKIYMDNIDKLIKQKVNLNNEVKKLTEEKLKIEKMLKDYDEDELYLLVDGRKYHIPKTTDVMGRNRRLHYEKGVMPISKSKSFSHISRDCFQYYDECKKNGYIIHHNEKILEDLHDIGLIDYSSHYYSSIIIYIKGLDRIEFITKLLKCGISVSSEVWCCDYSYNNYMFGLSSDGSIIVYNPKNSTKVPSIGTFNKCIKGNLNIG